MRIAALMLVVCAACTKSPRHDDTSPPERQAATPPSGAHVYLTTPDRESEVNVEVVKSPAALEHGLMFRTHMLPDDGMLFLMGSESDWSFWMHNTLIPLDMIFITKDLTVAGVVQNAVPQTDTTRSVGAISLYVLEVNGGWASLHGVKAGAKVRFDAVEANAK